MDKKIFVRVVVYESDVVKATGTGYPVSNGVILTSRHVLRASRNSVDKACPDTYRIEVHWPYYNKQGFSRAESSPGDDECYKSTDVSVSWKVPHSDFDLVLLECNFPQSVRAYGRISFRKTEAGKTAEIWGYPRIGKQGGDSGGKDVSQRSVVNFRGETSPQCRRDYNSSKENIFFFDSTTSPSSRDEWRGLSGAPIFYNDSIIGVVQGALKKYAGNKRLTGVSLSNLREDKNFCRLIGLSEEEIDYESGVKDFVVNKSKGNFDVASFLIGVSMDVGDLSAVSNDEIWSIFTSYSIEEFLRKSLDVATSLEGRGCGDSVKAIKEIVAKFFPYIYHPEKSRCFSVEEGGPPIVSIDVATPEVAEVVRARSERRSANFRAVKEERGVVFRYGNDDEIIDPAPEVGPINSIDKIMNGIDSHLKALYLKERGGRNMGIFESKNKSDFFPFLQGVAKSRSEQKCKYFLFIRKNDVDDWGNFISLAKCVVENYFGIICFVELSSQFTLEEGYISDKLANIYIVDAR